MHDYQICLFITTVRHLKVRIRVKTETKKSLIDKKLYFRASLEYFCISLVHILVFPYLYFSISLFTF